MPMLPNATVAAGGWQDQSTGTTNLHAPLADENPSTYIQSPVSPSAATVKLGLTDIGTPAAGDVFLYIDVEQV